MNRLATFGLAAVMPTAATLTAGSAMAQPSPTPALDIIPVKIPFAMPYGAPITLERVQNTIAAAMAEMNKRGWAMGIAVMDSGGNLVAFARMDSSQLSSIAISEHEARHSKRPHL